jgi:outer membrane protein TolC
VNRYKEISDVANTREIYGFGNKLDTQQATVHLNLAEDELSQINNALTIAETTFKGFLSLPKESKIVLAEDFSEMKENCEEMDNDALNALKIKITESNIAESVEEINYAKRQWWPDIALYGTYNRKEGSNISISIDSNLNFKMSYANVNEQPISYFSNNYVLGLNASYELFDGHRFRENVKVMNNQYEANVNKKNIVMRDLANERIRDVSTMVNAFNRLNSLNKICNISKQNIDMADIKYKQGKITLIQLLQIESDDVNTRRKIIEAEYDYNVSKEKIQKEKLMEDYAYEF